MRQQFPHNNSRPGECYEDTVNYSVSGIRLSQSFSKVGTSSNSWRLVVMAGAALLLLGPGQVNAREYDPHIMYVFPAGGQRGTTIETITRGRGLEGASQVRISGGGITAKIIAIEKPSTRLRQRSANRQDQSENPNVVRIAVTIAPDATLGQRDLRLVTSKGATNRVRFVIGQIPEVREAEQKSPTGEAQLLESLPILVNGQVFQGDRDVFRFQAKAGQTLVCEVDGRRLKPFIADAVPGWLQASLTLYDAAGQEVAYDDDFRFDPDPVLIYNVKADGEYQVEIKDVLYRGREDLVYRLSIGALPYLTDIFPLGWKRNSPAQIQLCGVNLPQDKLTFPVPNDSPPERLVAVTAKGLSSNALPFAVGDTPEMTEAEPNDSIEQANEVTVPITVNGRIQKCGDLDHFIFNVPKRQTLVIELFGRRLNSPIDSLITILNSKGQELRENDDYVDPAHQMIIHQADSRLIYDFRTPGDYLVRVKDVQSQGGEAYAYRLIVSPPRPDYTLRVLPDDTRVGQGANAVLTVNALRHDGFNGEIQLTVHDLPKGFIASPAVIPASQSQTRLTIAAPSDSPLEIFSPTIDGTATIAEHPVTRTAVPVEHAMQAFIYYHDIPTADFLVSTVAPPMITLSATAPANGVLEIEQGKSAQIVVKVSRDGIGVALKQAEAEKKAAEEVLANVRKELAAAKAGYDAAGKAARAADATIARSRTMVPKTAAAQVAAQKAATTKRQQANDARKKLDDLIQQQQKPAAAKLVAATTALTNATNAKAASDKLARATSQKKSAERALAVLRKQVAAATQAFQSADKAARDAEVTAAKAKTEADQARAIQADAQKTAIEQRKLVAETKTRRDKLTGDEKAANSRLTELKQRVEAVKQAARNAIALQADAPPRNITVKKTTIPIDKNEVAVTVTVAKQVPAGFKQNIIIKGTLKAGKDTVTSVAPAIPIQVTAPPKPKPKK